MRLDKNEIDSAEKLYHPTYKELLERVNNYCVNGDKLMHNLKQFYVTSKIAKVCESELLT
jgi:hypothetical protein